MACRLLYQAGKMLKRTKVKRLVVQRETLRHLQADQLAQVIGGGARGTTRCSHSDDWTYTCDADGSAPKKP